MPTFNLAVGLLCMASFVTPAAASVQSQTTYNYFTVTGKTPRRIYIAMLARDPARSDADAMASTNVTLSQHPRITVSPNCRMAGFTVKLTFRINLPRLENPNAFAPDAKRIWTSFGASLKAHEERHRAIWMAAAEDLSRQALRIKPGNCESFKNSYAEMSKNFLAKSAAENRAFDKAERTRFLSLPFIRLVASSQ